MAYSTVQGVYRFDADGDWFTFSGNIDSYDGGGALKTDVWYAPEQLGLDSWTTMIQMISSNSALSVIILDMVIVI